MMVVLQTFCTTNSYIYLPTFLPTTYLTNYLIKKVDILCISTNLLNLFLAGSFFPGVDINNLYTQNHQNQRIAQLTGRNTYVTSTQFLSRGHLTAKSDFVFATGQRASFYFINAAPQWQPFNAGNWNWLEQV